MSGDIQLRVDEQQRQASDPGASVWVSASAGTGKTHVLTGRVLRLLLDGTPPARILCLTFTKAAAAEMANRIHERLGRWAVLDDEALRAELFNLTGNADWAGRYDGARRLFASALETPGGLKVQTIHAFCEALLRRFPLEADLPPHFDVLDERDAGELLAAARDVALERTDPEAVALITDLVGEGGFGELMRELSSDRGRLRRMLGGGLAQAEAALCRHLQTTADDPEGLLAAACADGAFDRDGLRRAAVGLADGGKEDCRTAGLIAAWLEAADADTRLAGLDDYVAAFLRADGQPRARLCSRKVEEADAAVRRCLEAEADRLAGLKEQIAGARLVLGSRALLRLAGALIDTYEAAKLAQARLDYDDLILRARDLLESPGVAPWVLYKLDGGLDHILIDEAQDTNPDQWRVVRALADEFFAGEGARTLDRTIFAVGDPKQSIFSFQRADPAAFVQYREHFGALVRGARQLWRPVELAVSFRSTEPVLRLVDDVFAGPEAADGVHDMRVPLIHHLRRRGDAGLVELWPLEAKTATDDPAPWQLPLEQMQVERPESRLAQRVAGTIAGWLRDGEVLESEGRPIRPGDILILLQRRAPFLPEILRALKGRGVPVAGADRMILTEQTAIRDLMALARFVLHIDDDLSLAEVLKGPLIGLDDAALFELAYGRTGSLWRRLQETGGPIRDRLARWRALAEAAAPYDFFARLLDAEGGRQALLARLGPDADDPLDEFLSLALAFEQGHTPSLQRFLAWLQAAPTEVKRDQEQRLDEVRIMTVHGAKGLQAPIVILPDTTRAPESGGMPPRLHWLKTAGGADEALLWLPRKDLANGAAARLGEAARSRREQEHRRLLYVALTRPRDRLYIAGWATSEKGEHPGCWYALVAPHLRRMGEPVPFPEDRTARRLACAQARPIAPAAAAWAPAPAPLPAWATTAPAAAVAARAVAPSRAAEAEPPVRRPLLGDAGWGFRRGILVHRLLELLPGVPAPEAAAARLLDRLAGDVDPSLRRALADEVLVVLAHPGFARVFAGDSLAEVPVCGRIGDLEVAGQVDRLYVAADGVWVVDYKSHRDPPAEAAAAPPAHLRQMALYRALLRQIYTDRPVNCALLWTAGPTLTVLPQALLDGYAP